MDKIRIYYYLVSLGFICLILIGFVFYLFFNDSSELKRENCLSQKRKHFKGIVKYRFTDVSNKGLFTIVIQNNIDEFSYVNYAMDRPEAIIEVGDSVIKHKDTFKFVLIKNAYPDSVIVIENKRIDCDR